jgi:hypothetical protein
LPRPGYTLVCPLAGLREVLETMLELAAQIYIACVSAPFPAASTTVDFHTTGASATCPGVSGLPATAANIACQMPRSLQPAKRL